MRRLAVIGHPVAHSRSPAMQNAALADLGLAGEWAYEALDLEPAEFEGRVRALPGEGFAGANVTVPHKVAALALCGEASEAAQAIGAANTLTFAGDVIRADNTDAAGLLGAIGDSPAGMRALVLGAGGSARAVVWALVSEGADVSVWNRTPERAERLTSELGGTALGSRAPEAGYELIVNCTTVGMPGGADGSMPSLKQLPLHADALKATHLVVDLAYSSLETDLVRAARQQGARAVDGLEVLVHQGAASLRIWTGEEPSLEVMRRAAREAPR